MKANPIVRVAGREFIGWQSLSVTRSIESPSAKLQIDMRPHEVRSTGEEVPWRIRPGAEISINVPGASRRGQIGNDSLFTGYIDAVGASLEGSQRKLTAVARCNSAAAVDCSAQWDPGEFRDITPIELARKLVAPFDFQVRLPADLLDPSSDGVAARAAIALSPTVYSRLFDRRIKLIRVDPGESVWSVLERSFRLFGAIAFGNEDGDIEFVIAAASRSLVTLREGKNIISGKADYSHEDRFSEYRLVGQGPGTDEAWGNESSHIVGVATDRAISRYRPLTVPAEGTVTPDGAQTRAEWEAAIRAARGSKATLVIPGWTQERRTDADPAYLWRVNETVQVISESLGLRDRLLVSETAHSISSDGAERTTLKVTRKDGYIPQPDLDPSNDLLGDEEDDPWAT